MTKLLSLAQAEQLTINQTWRYYQQFVNAGQVELISTFGFGQELIAKAEGCELTTTEGKVLLDFTGGIGVLNHGHNHPRILAARQRFADQQFMEVHKNYFSPYLAALSHNIAQLMPGDLNICYFPNSGAEAVEGAMKMAYKYHQGKRKTILHSDISYHGKLHGAGSISASKELHFRFPEIPHCHCYPYGDIEALREQVNRLVDSQGHCDIYAIIIEPMSASSLRCVDQAYLQELRNIADQHNILLIFDEVFTGWGKTGELFYFMHFDVLPDIIITSKSLGGGKASIAGYIAREKVFQQAYGKLADTTLHSTTYNGFGEECYTAIEAINVLIEEDLVANAQAIGQQLTSGLTQLQAKFPTTIKHCGGIGALQGIQLTTGPEILQKLMPLIPGSFFNDSRFVQKLITASVINELYHQHKVLTYYGENNDITLMAAPSLIATEQQVTYYLDALEQCLSQGLLTLVMKFVRSKLFAKFLLMQGG